jgi:hypothetical protein
MGEANIGLDDSARHGCRLTLGGAAGRAGVYTLCNFMINMSVEDNCGI